MTLIRVKNKGCLVKITVTNPEELPDILQETFLTVADKKIMKINKIIKARRVGYMDRDLKCEGGE